MRNSVPFAVCLAALCPAAVASAADPLPDAVREALEKADVLELYSLEPNDAAGKDGFHDTKVLGKTAVKEPAARKKLLAALAKGVADNEGVSAQCFQPRHGLRAVLGGETVDLAICFECLQIRIYRGDKESTVLVTGGPEGAFDELLKAAKVPLAPKNGK